MNQYYITSAKILGQTLRAARQEKGLTQGDLANLAGLQQKTVSNAENGSQGVKIGTIFQILSALEMDILLAPRGRSVKDSGEW